MTMAGRSFGIYVFATLTLENYMTFGYSAGSMIWSRNNESFIPIANIPAFRAEEQNYLRKSRDLETHDFEKAVLKVAYYEEENIIHFYDNDTRITGVFGELWNVLSDYLNFTMVMTKVENRHFGVEFPNGSYDGLLGMLHRNDIQIIPRTGCYVAESKIIAYTMAVWNDRYRLYIRPELTTDSTWMFNMLSRRVWGSIILLLLSLSVIGYKMQKTSIRVSGDKNICHNLHDYLFYTYATFCCQGFIPDSLYDRTKILGFSKKMLAWLILITISSHLISYMSNQKVQPPFVDIGTMLNSTTYNIVVFDGSIVFDKFKRTVAKFEAIDRYKKRFFYVHSPDRMYEKGCWGKKKYAILDSGDRQRAYGRFKCNLVPTGISYFDTWITAGTSKTFKYKRTIDMGILKLSECGITDALKDRWLAINIVNVDSNIVTSINFNQVSMLFMILCIGTIASIVIFTLENIVSIYQYNKRKVQRTKTFYSQAYSTVSNLPLKGATSIATPSDR